MDYRVHREMHLRRFLRRATVLRFAWLADRDSIKLDAGSVPSAFCYNSLFSIFLKF